MGDCNQAKQQQQPRMNPGDVIPGGGRVNGLFASMPGPPLIPGTGPTSITPGGAAQIVPGAGYPPSNGMFPGSSPQLIPGQSQNIIPGQNQNLFPGQSPNIIPGPNQNIIPGQNGNPIPGQSQIIIPVIPDPKCDPFIEDGVWVVPDCNRAKQQQGPRMNPGDVIPGGGRTNGLFASLIPGATPGSITPGGSPQIIPGTGYPPSNGMYPGSGSIIPGQPQNMIPGQNGNIIPGQNGNIIPVIPDPKCDPFIEDGVWAIPDCNQAKQQQQPRINPGDVIPGG